MRRPVSWLANASLQGSFPKTGKRIRGIFGLFLRGAELVALESVCYADLSCDVRIRASNRDFPSIAFAERCKMTLTVAHISPIISLVAGVLILVMPRLLNLIVAIWLILNGLIGLGLLKWIHL
jgi:Protein of unknown function (DUF3096)